VCLLICANFPFLLLCDKVGVSINVLVSGGPAPRCSGVVRNLYGGKKRGAEGGEKNDFGLWMTLH